VRRLLVLCGVAALVIAACSNGDDAAEPTFPSVTGTVATLPAPASTAVPQGYEAIVLRVTDAAGQVHEWCVLVADTEAKRQRGLMEVDGLGGYDGMLFTFDQPTSGSFYMYKTRLPLSIAFFESTGAFVSATDMPPCTAEHAGDCPLYQADAPYVNALEVPMGGLAALGVGPGSRITTGGRCERTRTG
jgi:uncharacterized membrane protein (UPF0127 family)